MSDRADGPTRRKILGAFAAGTASVALGRPLSAAQPTTVAFGSVGGLSDAGIYLADAYGYFAAAGIAVVIQQINSAPTLVQTIAASQIDVAGISVSPGLFASVGMHIALRIVGDKQSYRPGFSGMRLIARPRLVLANKAATIAALRGKTIAISAKGSVSYYLLDRVLASAHLTLRDVNVVELAYPNMYPAFTTGVIDAAISLEPFLTQTLIPGAAREITDLVEFAPGENMTNVPLVYSENFAKNRSLAQGFMTAYIRGVRIYNDAFVKGKDKEKVIAIVAKRAKLEPSVVRLSHPFGLQPDQRITIPALEDIQRFFIREKMLDAPASIAKLVDESFADQAVATLGHYRA